MFLPRSSRAIKNTKHISLCYFHFEQFPLMVPCFCFIDRHRATDYNFYPGLVSSSSLYKGADSATFSPSPYVPTPEGNQRQYKNLRMKEEEEGKRGREGPARSLEVKGETTTPRYTRSYKTRTYSTTTQVRLKVLLTQASRGFSSSPSPNPCFVECAYAFVSVGKQLQPV